MAGLDVRSAPVVTPLDKALVQAVGDFCRWAAGADMPIQRGWANAVSRPRDGYVVVTPFGTTWQSTTTRTGMPRSNATMFAKSGP